MFDQSKHENYTSLGSNSKSNNHSSQKPHYRQTIDSNSHAQNSARYPDINSNNQMKRNLSASKKDNYRIYDNYDNQRWYTQEAENNEENISKPNLSNYRLIDIMNVNTRSKPLPHRQSLNLEESRPPTHPSKSSNRKYDEKGFKNQDLKLSYENKNEFLTVGRDSK